MKEFPGDEPVAYVTMTGDFITDASVVLHNGFAVFDVTSGNILMSGAR